MARLQFSVAAAAVALFNPVSATIAARQTGAPDVEAISDCTVVASTQYCSAGSTEFRVVSTPTSGSLPSSYTGCHAHGDDLYCMFGDGDEVEVAPATGSPSPTAAAANDDHDHSHSDDDDVTALSGCHLHDTDVFCMWGESEYSMDTTATATEDIPAEYTGCHDHGPDLYCFDGEDDIKAVPQDADDSDDENKHCHFHSGVEHCVGDGESESGGQVSCERVDRDYDIPLRIGLIFVIMATSAIGVFSPIFLTKFLPPKLHVVLLILKQFGTGVVISTAFIHLYTHAELMFTDPCLTGVEFEGTTASVVMGGIFASFLVEFIGQRFARAKMAKGVDGRSWFRPETVSIMVLEAGILFHSVLIGITLVVAGDSFFLTLFAVIVFHQVFEGIALGTRIAALGTPAVAAQAANRMGVGQGHGHGHGHMHLPSPNTATKGPEDTTRTPETASDSADESLKAPHFSLAKKCLLASAFALVTPLGMAIGIGVIHNFHGRDPSTLLTIAILDAISAGILIWVGVVEMWAEDWMFSSSELMNASWPVVGMGLFGLMAGMALMGFLGKWA